MKLFACVMVEKEDWESPTLKMIAAEDGDDAFVKFAESLGHTEESLDEGCQDGEIVVEIISGEPVTK